MIKDLIKNIITNNDRVFCVYAHINKINGKMYIGQTIYGNNPNKRWKHGNGYRTQVYFYRAIKKYGWDNFDHEIIASHLTQKEAYNFEKLLIRKFDLKNPLYGYNVTDGGEGVLGFHHSKESLQKQRESMRKYFDDPEYRQRMSDVVKKREICQFTLNGDYIQTYKSIKEAERQTGIYNSYISKNALGKNPSTYGYIFVFKEEINTIAERVERYNKSKKPRREPIVQLTLDGEFIREWNGSAEAGNALGIQYKNINAVCRGKRNKAGEYKWMYISDYNKMCNKIN